MNKRIRDKARELYENEPITLKEISERLRINYNTIRSWKYTDSITEPWEENFKHRHRRMTQKQLDNLIWQTEANQTALKHGLYRRVPWVAVFMEEGDSYERARLRAGMPLLD